MTDGKRPVESYYTKGLCANDNDDIHSNGRLFFIKEEDMELDIVFVGLVGFLLGATAAFMATIYMNRHW